MKEVPSLKFLINIFLISLLLSSCSTFDKHDDVVRIKKDSASKYEKFISPDGEKIRNGNALRGTVINIIQQKKIDCSTKDTVTSYFVHFLDSLAESNPDYAELIPIEGVDLIGPITPNIPENEFGKINYFEYYANPLNEKNIREVPVEPIIINDCETDDCGCNQKQLMLPNVKIKCPNCKKSWFFLELRGGYALYSDFQYQLFGVNQPNQFNMNTARPIGRDEFIGEVAAGFRFNNWGIGLAYNTGIKVNNQFDTNYKDFNRSFLLLHGRYTFNPPTKYGDYEFPFLKFLYDFAEATCTRPFVFSQFGVGLDKLTMDLMKVKICEDCESQISYEPCPECEGNLDLSLPISWAIGAGMDIPLPGCLFDLSLDLSYRNYSVGETLETYEYKNVPSRRRLDMFVFRFGITF